MLCYRGPLASGQPPGGQASHRFASITPDSRPPPEPHLVSCVSVQGHASPSGSACPAAAGEIGDRLRGVRCGVRKRAAGDLGFTIWLKIWGGFWDRVGRPRLVVTGSGWTGWGRWASVPADRGVRIRDFPVSRHNKPPALGVHWLKSSSSAGSQRPRLVPGRGVGNAEFALGRSVAVRVGLVGFNNSYGNCDWYSGMAAAR